MALLYIFTVCERLCMEAVSLNPSAPRQVGPRVDRLHIDHLALLLCVCCKRIREWVWIIVNTLWNKPHDKAFFSPIIAYGLFYLIILTIIGI